MKYCINCAHFRNRDFGSFSRPGLGTCAHPKSKEPSPREFSAIVHSGGVVLCDKQEGAFIVLRFAEDVERLRDLLAKIEIKKSEP